MPKNSIVVFDIDGTLTESAPAHQLAFEATLSSFGFPALRTDWASYRHYSDSAIFCEAWEEAAFDGSPDIESLEKTFAVQYDKIIAESPFGEIPGAATFVRKLAASERWAVVFASGSLRHGARSKLGVIGVNPDEVVLVTASEFQTREDIVSRAIQSGQQRYDLDSPDRIVSIGDGLWDRKTASTLGYDFVGIASGPAGAVLEEEGHLVIPNFADERLSAYLALST